MAAIDEMRAKFNRMTPEGIDLILHGVMSKRAKKENKRLICAVGLAVLKGKDAAQCKKTLESLRLKFAIEVDMEDVI